MFVLVFVAIVVALVARDYCCLYLLALFVTVTVTVTKT